MATETQKTNNAERIGEIVSRGFPPKGAADLKAIDDRVKTMILQSSWAAPALVELRAAVIRLAEVEVMRDNPEKRTSTNRKMVRVILDMCEMSDDATRLMENGAPREQVARMFKKVRGYSRSIISEVEKDIDFIVSESSVNLAYAEYVLGKPKANDEDTDIFAPAEISTYDRNHSKILPEFTHYKDLFFKSGGNQIVLEIYKTETAPKSFSSGIIRQQERVNNADKQAEKDLLVNVIREEMADHNTGAEFEIRGKSHLFTNEDGQVSANLHMEKCTPPLRSLNLKSGEWVAILHDEGGKVKKTLVTPKTENGTVIKGAFHTTPITEEDRKFISYVRRRRGDTFFRYRDSILDSVDENNNGGTLEFENKEASKRNFTYRLVGDAVVMKSAISSRITFTSKACFFRLMDFL